MSVVAGRDLAMRLSAICSWPTAPPLASTGPKLRTKPLMYRFTTMDKRERRRTNRDAREAAATQTPAISPTVRRPPPPPPPPPIINRATSHARASSSTIGRFGKACYLTRGSTTPEPIALIVTRLGRTQHPHPPPHSTPPPPPPPPPPRGRMPRKGVDRGPCPRRFKRASRHRMGWRGATGCWILCGASSCLPPWLDWRAGWCHHRRATPSAPSIY